MNNRVCNVWFILLDGVAVVFLLWFSNISITDIKTNVIDKDVSESYLRHRQVALSSEESSLTENVRAVSNYCLKNELSHFQSFLI